jgi:hypothetical protein
MENGKKVGQKNRNHRILAMALAALPRKLRINSLPLTKPRRFHRLPQGQIMPRMHSRKASTLQ